MADRFPSCLIATAFVLIAVSPGAASDIEQCSDAANPESTIRACSRVIEQADLDDRSVAVAYNNRGNAYTEQGEFALAIVDYSTALALNSSYAFAYNNRGVAHQARGELENALRDLSKAIDLQPDYALAYANRSEVHSAQGSAEKATVDCKRAREIEPSIGCLTSSPIQTKDHQAAE